MFAWAHLARDKARSLPVKVACVCICVEMGSSVSKLITIKAGGRNLSIQGTFENYLQWYDGWDTG